MYKLSGCLCWLPTCWITTIKEKQINLDKEMLEFKLLNEMLIFCTCHNTCIPNSSVTVPAASHQHQTIYTFSCELAVNTKLVKHAVCYQNSMPPSYSIGTTATGLILGGVTLFLGALGQNSWANCKNLPAMGLLAPVQILQQLQAELQKAH
jgi:hypothetical protein